MRVAVGCSGYDESWNRHQVVEERRPGPLALSWIPLSLKPLKVQRDVVPLPWTHSSWHRFAEKWAGQQQRNQRCFDPCHR